MPPSREPNPSRPPRPRGTEAQRPREVWAPPNGALVRGTRTDSREPSRVPLSALTLGTVTRSFLYSSLSWRQ